MIARGYATNGVARTHLPRAGHGCLKRMLPCRALHPWSLGEIFIP